MSPLHAPRVAYVRLAQGAPLPANALAAIGFGASPALPDDPRSVRVGLEPLHGAGLTELWLSSGAVRTARHGAIRYAYDDAHLFGIVEIDEREHGGIAGAAQAAYATIRAFRHETAGRDWCVLRMWNYCDAINAGEGDEERYRHFCAGRAAGLASLPQERLPAATAIGRRDGETMLQVYFLAAREPGVALENPRQVSAYRYPRQYGPTPPSFSRAMLDAGSLLLISGTASVVGHASHHAGDLVAQLEETVNNLQTVLERARALSPQLPTEFDSRSVLKVYLRDPARVAEVEDVLARRLPGVRDYVILAGDVCRADLLVEIDGSQPAAG
ncbi:MAG TPA: pteridine-dependent deoxygenase [Xanthomonadales bacterium]|nr:pteridine-dependent deoxygenase [Xanthomonadales bacterium]